MRDDGPNRSLVYSPETPTEHGPLIVIFHGGGWCTCFPEVVEPYCVHLANTYGATVIAAGYRLASAFTFPTAPNDAWDVVKWAAANAAKLGADPSKGFIVGGMSAGANLASVVSHLARDEKLSPPLTGVWLDEPNVVDPSVVPEKWRQDYKSIEQFKDNTPILDKADVEWYKNPASPLYSPLIWPSGHENLPPHYFLLQGMDPLRDEGLIYERTLREDCGVKTKLDVIPGVPHGFHHMLPTFSKSGPAIQKMFEGIDWLLKQK
ncbi:Alpha/beta hydrolase fold-3 [Lophium mytilinum]|uniref:Alpha/beta hydrolase fold-3 n=1 Tax=Lophium mytilinum TaxID=390894 RepID=A0A6A6QHT8_9PEZI|nr:Alpha/beta hydrolase fold-3 [Lophium mytilinum]